MAGLNMVGSRALPYPSPSAWFCLPAWLISPQLSKPETLGRRVLWADVLSPLNFCVVAALSIAECLVMGICRSHWVLKWRTLMSPELSAHTEEAQSLVFFLPCEDAKRLAIPAPPRGPSPGPNHAVT